MDKKERSSLVQAKMNKMIAEENAKCPAEVDMSNINSVIKELNYCDEMLGLYTMMADYEEIREELIVKTRVASENFPSNRGRVGQRILASIPKVNPSQTLSMIYDGYPNVGGYDRRGHPKPYTKYKTCHDLMATLIEYQDSDNKRLKKAATLGLKLILNEDLNELKEFIGL